MGNIHLGNIVNLFFLSLFMGVMIRRYLGKSVFKAIHLTLW
jgi:hypothetical protein